MQNNTPPYWMTQETFCSLRQLRAHELQQQIGYGAQDWVFICPWGSGNVYTMMALLDSFMHYHCRNGEKIFVILRQKYEEIARMFGQFSDRVTIVARPGETFPTLQREFGTQHGFTRGATDFIRAHLPWTRRFVALSFSARHILVRYQQIYAQRAFQYRTGETHNPCRICATRPNKNGGHGY